MPDASAPAAPAASRFARFAARLALPLTVLATWALGLLLLAFGVLRLLPTGTVDAPPGLARPAGAELIGLATGGVIGEFWGIVLVGVLQISLGLGLLVPAGRGMAGLGCLFAAVAVAFGMVWHWQVLSVDNGMNEAGVALLILCVLLLAGAALGALGAARRVQLGASQ